MDIGALLFNKAMRTGLFQVVELHDGYSLRVRVLGMWIGLVQMKKDQAA